MAVVNILPNGYLVVTLTPREAIMVCDELLDPGDFPWQSSESQMVALEVKSKVKGIIEHVHNQQTNMLKNMIPHHQVQEESEEEEEEEPQEKPPDEEEPPPPPFVWTPTS